MRPLVELRDVSARNLRDVDLEIGDGVTAVIGPNGSGKTTLLRIIAGVLKPERGKVKAPGRVGASWQNPYYSFYHDTVLGEVESVVGNRDRAMELLDRYGLSSQASRPPFTLSMGQARLLSILLATAWRPDMVVIDEPTSGLGVREKTGLADMLRDLRIPVVMASHDLDFVLDASDRLIVLVQGRVVLEGDTIDVLYGEDLYSLGFPRPVTVEVGLRVGKRVRGLYSCITS